MNEFNTKQQLNPLQRPAGATSGEDQASAADSIAPELDELDLTRKIVGPAFAEIAALFKTDSQLRIMALTEACAENDLKKLTSVAHSFSGSCASLGASQLSALCTELEIWCKAGLANDLDVKLDGIKTEYAHVIARLEQILQMPAT